MTPHTQHEGVQREPVVIIQERKGPGPQQGQPNPPIVARRPYIRQRDVELYGYTHGCPKCDHARLHGANRTTVKHSETCRARLLAEIAKTDQGRQRIERAGERMDEYTADLGERLLKQPPGGDLPDGGAAEVRPRPAAVRPPASREPRDRARQLGANDDRAGRAFGQAIDEHDEVPAVDPAFEDLLRSEPPSPSTPGGGMELDVIDILLTSTSRMSSSGRDRKVRGELLGKPI